MALTFYTNPMSRGQIARWALHEAGVDYDQKLVAYGEEMKGEPYISINPMGKVPAIDHDGAIVTEVAAICAYLAEAFPGAGLAPTEAERPDYLRWLFFAAGPLESAVTNKSMGWSVDDPQKKGMLGYGDYDLAVSVLEKTLEGRDYICGDRFTMADVYVGSQVGWGTQFGTLPGLDAFRDYAARVQMREAYKEAKAIDMELIAEAQGEES